MSIARKILERNRKHEENLKFLIKEDFMGVGSIGELLKKYQSIFVGEFVSAVKKNYAVLDEKIKKEIKEDDFIKLKLEETDDGTMKIEYEFQKNAVNPTMQEFSFVLKSEGNKIAVDFEAPEEFINASEIQKLIDSYKGKTYGMSDFATLIENMVQFNRDLVFLYFEYIKEVKSGASTDSYKTDIINNTIDYFYTTINKEVFINKLFQDNVTVTINKDVRTISITINTPDKLQYAIADYAFSPEQNKFAQINFNSNIKGLSIKNYKSIALDNIIDFVSDMKKDLANTFKADINKGEKAEKEKELKEATDKEKNEISIQIAQVDKVAKKFFISMNGTNYEYELKNCDDNFDKVEQKLREILKSNLSELIPFVLGNLKVLNVSDTLPSMATEPMTTPTTSVMPEPNFGIDNTPSTAPDMPPAPAELPVEPLPNDNIPEQTPEELPPVPEVIDTPTTAPFTSDIDTDEETGFEMPEGEPEEDWNDEEVGENYSQFGERVNLASNLKAVLVEKLNKGEHNMIRNEEFQKEEIVEEIEKNEIVHIATATEAKDIVAKVSEMGEPEALTYAFEKYGRIKKESRWYTDNIEEDLKTDDDCIMVQLEDMKMVYNPKTVEVVLLKQLDEEIYTNKIMQMLPGMFHPRNNNKTQGNYMDLKEEGTKRPSRK